MNNKTKIFIFGVTLVAILALAALGGGVAFAQTLPPITGYAPGWMMNNSGQTNYGPGVMGGRGQMMAGYGQTGEGWEWMNAMHTWMNASGGMHTFVWAALAEQLGLDSAELTAAVNSGQTIAQVAEEKGISRATLITTLETAHQNALAQAVAEGYLTQEQADIILTQMSGRYEWMLDNAGAGYGMMGGYGGGYGRSGAAGQFAPGGCHGGWNATPNSSQTQP